MLSPGNLDGFIPAHLLHHIIHASTKSTILSHEEVLVRHSRLSKLAVFTLVIQRLSVYENITTPAAVSLQTRQCGECGKRRK